MFSIRKLSHEAQKANRMSGWNMNGCITVMAGRHLDQKVTVRAFGPRNTMIYYIDGVESSYRDVCKVLRGD